MANPIVTIATEDGATIKLEIFADRAPSAAADFLPFFENDYYHGLSFHTCVKDEYIQFGYPDINGYGVYVSDTDDVIEDGKLPDEEINYEYGSLTTITAKYPHLAKMQLAILFTDKPILSHGHHVTFKTFGRVIEGMDYAKKISESAVDEDFSPRVPTVIKNIVVE